MDIYEKIDMILVQKGVSRRRLSELSGIPHSTLASAFTRKSKLSHEMIKMIADALDVDPFQLITWNTDPEERQKEEIKYQSPIIQYLYSIGYSFQNVSAEIDESGQLVECQNGGYIGGKLVLPKNKRGYIALTKEDGKAIFSPKEFEEFQAKIKSSVEYLIWQQQSQK